jgi:predicted ester cyclase
MTGIEARPATAKEIVLKALAILTGDTSTGEVDELFRPDYVDHNAAGPSGPEWVVTVATRLRTAFPDLTHEVHDVIADGDLVALRTTMRGTQDGEFGPLKLPPSGRRIEIATFHVFRLVEGRLAEHWAVRDDLGMLRQLGAVPAPG